MTSPWSYLLRGGLVAVVVAPLALWAPGAIGRDGHDGRGREDCKSSQDCARDAFQNGEIRPLAEVIAAVAAKVPGEVVKVKLDREDGVWVYELKVLSPDGRRRDVEINAKTLEILDIDD